TRIRRMTARSGSKQKSSVTSPVCQRPSIVPHPFVIAGLVPAIHAAVPQWMPGSSPGMTSEHLVASGLVKPAEPIRFQSLLTSAINICDARFIGDADLQTRALIPRRKAISVRDQPPRIGIALDSRRDDRSPSSAPHRALRFRAAFGADVSDVIELPGDR